MLIRIILIFVSLMMIGRTVDRFRKGEVHSWSFSAWLLFWFSLGIVGIMPELTNYVANFLGVGRGADFAIYVSIVTVFYLLFLIFVRLERMEKHITQIVREVALREKEE